MIKFNLLIRHSKRLRIRTSNKIEKSQHTLIKVIKDLWMIFRILYLIFRPNLTEGTESNSGDKGALL
jgi:hypothetical protein